MTESHTLTHTGMESYPRSLCKQSKHKIRKTTHHRTIDKIGPHFPLVENNAHTHMPRMVTVGDWNWMEGQRWREKRSASEHSKKRTETLHYQSKVCVWERDVLPSLPTETQRSAAEHTQVTPRHLQHRKLAIALFAIIISMVLTATLMKAF